MITGGKTRASDTFGPIKTIHRNKMWRFKRNCRFRLIRYWNSTGRVPTHWRWSAREHGDVCMIIPLVSRALACVFFSFRLDQLNNTFCCVAFSFALFGGVVSVPIAAFVKAYHADVTTYTRIYIKRVRSLALVRKRSSRHCQSDRSKQMYDFRWEKKKKENMKREDHTKTTTATHRAPWTLAKER